MSKDKKEKFGAAGGKATLEKYGKDHYSRAAKKMHDLRRKKERQSKTKNK